MLKFCVFAEPRSGTTFFNSAVNSHPDIVSFGEVLAGYEGDNKFHAYWLGQIQNDPSKIYLQDIHMVFRGFIQDIFANRKEKALGFDIKYYQLEWKRTFMQVLKYEEFKVVHVIRQNILRRYVSFLFHQPRLRNALNRPMHTSSSHDPILIMLENPEQLVSMLREYEKRLRHYSRLLSENFSCLTLYYESMIDKELNFLSQDAMDQLFNFLEVPRMRTIPSSSLRKMNPTNLRYSVLNYYQAVEALKGTQYEPFLDDPEWDVENLELHKELSLGHVEMNVDPAKALVHYLKASSVNPDDAEPYFCLALVHMQTGQTAKVNAMFEKALELGGSGERSEYYGSSYQRFKDLVAASKPSGRA